MTGVESGDYIDSEGNIVSVDNDFSRSAEVQDLVKQALKIEMEKIEADAEFKTKEKVARAFIARFEREKREGEVFSIGACRVFLCFVLFAHCFTTVHE